MYFQQQLRPFTILHICLVYPKLLIKVDRFKGYKQPKKGNSQNSPLLLSYLHTKNNRWSTHLHVCYMYVKILNREHHCTATSPQCIVSTFQSQCLVSQESQLSVAQQCRVIFYYPHSINYISMLFHSYGRKCIQVKTSHRWLHEHCSQNAFHGLDCAQSGSANSSRWSSRWFTRTRGREDGQQAAGLQQKLSHSTTGGDATRQLCHSLKRITCTPCRHWR